MSQATLRNGQRTNKDGLPVPKIPPKDPRDIGSKPSQNSISLLDWQWEKVDEIAKAEGYNRNELMREVLRGFIDEWEADRAATPKRGASK